MRHGIVSSHTLRPLNTTNVIPPSEFKNYDRRPSDIDTKRAMLRHEWMEYVEREQGNPAE